MAPRTSLEEKERKHFKIFLLKEGIESPEDIFKVPDLPQIDIPDVGPLFYLATIPRQPKWLDLFDSLPEESRLKLYNSNTRAVLLANTRNRTFAVVFGYGRALIKDGVLESRFGLKVVLNSVNKDSLRSIDKTSIGSVPLHSREQLSRSGDPKDFGINFDEDLIRAVTGTSRDITFGKTISGSDILAVSVPCDLEDLKEFLGKCLDRSNSSDYKTDFAWVDQVQAISDKALINELFEEVVAKMKRSETDKIWMAVPEIIEWADVAGFRYHKAEDGTVFPDMSLDDFLSTVRNRENISVETLKQRDVFCVPASDHNPVMDWKVINCIYAEIDLRDGKYILTNKSWYRIASNYVEKIDAACAAIPTSTVTLPDYNASASDGQGDDKGEGGYNKSVCEADSANKCLMDRKLVSIGGSTPIEFCDVFTKDKKLIHVKRYGGSSSLSHLFQQGAVSGELFRGDKAFRNEVNSKLAAGFKLADPNVAPKQGEYEIVFAVINNSARDLELPFFSKITLQAVERRLSAFGYKVSIKKIKSVIPSGVVSTVPVARTARTRRA